VLKHRVNTWGSACWQAGDPVPCCRSNDATHNGPRSGGKDRVLGPGQGPSRGPPGRGLKGAGGRYRNLLASRTGLYYNKRSVSPTAGIARPPDQNLGRGWVGQDGKEAGPTARPVGLVEECGQTSPENAHPSVSL